MMSKGSEKIECIECGESLPVEWISSSKRKEYQCPKCGSFGKKVLWNISESPEVHESLKGKIRSVKFNSKNNPRVKFFEGNDLRKSDGKWMNKKRIIDRDKNEYFEEVIDPETGDVIRRCEEPLSDHVERGSAKLNKTNNME